MPLNSVGIVTARDGLTIDMDKDMLWKRVEDFAGADTNSLRARYNLGEDVRDWRVQWAKKDVIANFKAENLVRIAYRPFDSRWTFYTGNSRGFQCYPRHEVMQHLLTGKVFALQLSRQLKGVDGYHHVLAHCHISESSLVSNKTAEIGYSCPLYFLDTVDQTRRINFDLKIHKAVVAAATDASRPAAQAPQHEGLLKAPDEVEIFDYIYGVLHCPAYRETYKEFLKIDFPRVPYPASPDVFWDVSAKGSQLRKLHLMEDAAIGPAPYKFEGQGDSVVGKVSYDGGVVRINAAQGFDGVPEIAWNFYIGGYQPAQKWLKDRKGRALSFDDIKHYQKIIKILSETDRIMKTIDMPLN